MSWSDIQYIRQQKTPFILINSKLSIIIVDYGQKMKDYSQFKGMVRQFLDNVR